MIKWAKGRVCKTLKAMARNLDFILSGKGGPLKDLEQDSNRVFLKGNSGYNEENGV